MIGGRLNGEHLESGQRHDAGECRWIEELRMIGAVDGVIGTKAFGEEGTFVMDDNG